jgi:hypothetical protein
MAYDRVGDNDSSTSVREGNGFWIEVQKKSKEMPSQLMSSQVAFKSYRLSVGRGRSHAS